MTEQMKPSGLVWMGDIPQDWQIGRIKDYYILQTGFTPDTSMPEYYDDENGHNWVSISDIDDSKNIKKTKSKISSLYVTEKQPQISPAGSLLYSFKLSVGKVAFLNEAMYTNEAIASFVDTTDVHLPFLYYSSIFIEENANINIYGAKILNQELIKNSYTIFPPKEEQKKIAAFLDAKCTKIDGIIADIEKQIETLQKYKKSLITETVTKGLDKSAPMKDSGIEWIGEIPSGWKVEPIKYRVDFFNGDRGENYPSKAEMLTDGVPFINAGHLLNGGLDMENMDFISEEKYRVMGGVKLQENDILYCLRGSVGKNSILSINRGTVASSLVALRSKNISAKFLYYSLNSNIDEVQRFLWDNGTAQPNLSAENLGKFKICVPPHNEQKAIVDFLDSKCANVDTILNQKEKALTLLQQHKKSLIYEYVTGKKRVTEVN